MKALRIAGLALLTVLSGFCGADAVYDVSLDTAPLESNLNGPFSLDFQLTRGDTTSGVINFAILSQFQFGPGGAPGVGQPFPNSGNAAGSLGGTVTLSTSGEIFFNEFSQYFTPGDMLSFRLDLTNNPQPTLTPDEFSWQLIDSSANAISTTDPSGSNSLVIIDLAGTGVQPQIYTTNGDGISISPQLTSPVPEPATAPLIASLCTLLIAFYKVNLRRQVQVPQWM